MRELTSTESKVRKAFEKAVAQGVSKSQEFKRLYDEGYTIGDISKITTSHYSFVYGVISESREIVKKPGVSKSDEIRALADSGLTTGQIAKQLNSNYSFVFSVVKKHQKSKERGA